MIEKKQIPSYLYNSSVFKTSLDIINEQFENYEEIKKDIENQLSPLTATWGLERWEKCYGITNNDELDIELRRAKILSKLLAGQTMTIENMKKILSPFSKEIEIEQIPNEYRFNIKFLIELEDKNKVDNIYATINDIKPAHLGFFIGFADSIKLKISGNFRVQTGNALQTGDHYANSNLRVK